MKEAIGRENARDLILDAADRLLAHCGYKKMSMDDLARDLGISKATIYHHFSSKEEMTLSNYDRVIERLKGELKIIAEKKIPPEERIRQMLLKRVLHRFDSVQHYTQSLNDLLSAMRPKMLVRRKIYFEAEAEIFAVVIEEGQKAKTLSGENSLETAITLLIATNSLLPTALTTRELGERDEIADKTQRLANLILTGLVRHD